MSSSFDPPDVSLRTTSWVREQAKRGRGGWIFGPTGSGKSHAVRAASLGGISVDLVPGPLMGQRLAVDLARQLETDGRAVLEATRHRGLAAALEIADQAIDGHPFVVDSAEQLVVEPASPDDPATVLWRDDKLALRHWLLTRVERSPTFLVSRWSTGEEPQRHQHRAPDGAEIEWRISSNPLELPLLAKLAQDNPAASVIARALAPLISAEDFDELLFGVFEDEASASAAMVRQQIGRAFQSVAPRGWQRILALLAVVGEAPRDVIETMLDGRAAVEGDARESITDDALIALRQLQQLDLVIERAGRLSVLPALRAFGAIRTLTDQERAVLLPGVAHSLLAPVNNLRSLDPTDADRVLLAHSVFVALGDMGNAERTAVLHVHGLVDLARRSSLNERFFDAWQQYDGVLRMLTAGEIGVGDRAGQQLVSYVRHYRAWNGFRAGALDDAACLADYQRAVEGWADNALWHQRVIQTLIRLGRLVDARRAIDTAYTRVEAHPRRDELLRVRPAGVALEAGAVALSLELLEPLLDVAWERSPEVADGRDALLRRWSKGLRLEELSFWFVDTGAEGIVKLLQPLEVRVRQSRDGWVARATGLDERRATTPGLALVVLARSLAEEARRLVATPTSDLGDRDIRRKGLLLSYVDVLNSDIGLDRRRERWIVGRVEDRRLIPTLRRLPPIDVPSALLPETTEGLYFVRVPVYRDGIPSGPAEAIESAGSGYSLHELLAQLERMNEQAA